MNASKKKTRHVSEIREMLQENPIVDPSPAEKTARKEGPHKSRNRPAAWTDPTQWPLSKPRK